MRSHTSVANSGEREVTIIIVETRPRNCDPSHGKLRFHLSKRGSEDQNGRSFTLTADTLALGSVACVPPVKVTNMVAVYATN